MREKIASWNRETVGLGRVVNEVSFTYNDVRQVTHDYQAPSSTVKVVGGTQFSGTKKVLQICCRFSPSN